MKIIQDYLFFMYKAMNPSEHPSIHPSTLQVALPFSGIE